MKFNDNYIIKEVLGNYILIDLSGQMKDVIKLNETSKTIISYLQQNLTREEIIDKMLSEYEVDKEAFVNDLDELLNKLKDLNVIYDWRTIRKG